MAEPIPNLDIFLNGNPNDILLITNPDVGCDDVDSMEGWSHKDYFQVKFDSKPHRIAPGQQKRYPRWLAKHYAKHLADHILIKQSTEKHLLLNDVVRRPQVLGTIFVSVDELFEETEPLTEGEKAVKEVEELNSPVSATAQEFGGGKSMDLPEDNLGSIPDPTVGVLTTSKGPNPPQTTEVKAKPTRKELFAEAEKLGIETTGKEKVDDLIEMISKF